MLHLSGNKNLYLCKKNIRLIHPKKIFEIRSEEDFNHLSLRIFHYQYANNEVYRDFVDKINVSPSQVQNYREIPFLPVEFFKTRKVIAGEASPEVIFSSSGTGNSGRSRHYVTDADLYRHSFRNSFEKFYGKISDYTFFALLPAYLERKGSSLVTMAEDFIKSGNTGGGFFLYDFEELQKKLQIAENKGIKSILIGVSFALLDFFEQYPQQLKHTIVMETGGMKGRRKELIRRELHEILRKNSGVSHIHSEYGMTELLSQAYSKGNGLFHPPNWMKILIRDPYDPLSLLGDKQSGGINIIDLANLHSCSFIATHDLGRTFSDGTFEVSGRFDNSDIRGCNLLIINN